MKLAYNTTYNKSIRLILAYVNFRFTPNTYYYSYKLDIINPTVILKVDKLKKLI